MSGEQRLDEKHLAEMELRAETVFGDAASTSAVRQICEDAMILASDLRSAQAEIERLKVEAEKRASEGWFAGIEAMRGPMHDQRRLGAEEEREACARLADSEEPTGALARLIRARGGAS